MDAEVRLIRWGGYAAIGAVAVGVAGIVVALVLTGGEFPDSTRDADALAYLADNQGGMAWLTWLLTLSFGLSLVAVLGFHATLRTTKLPLVVGTVLATVGLVFWALWGLLNLAVVFDLAPAYAGADAASRAAIEAAGRGMLTASVAFDSVAWVLFGTGVLLFALAILETRAVPRWLGWYGLAIGVVHLVVGPGHWIDSTVVPTLEGVVGVLWFIWLAGMGVSMVRKGAPAAGSVGGSV